jgi:hypothetical protein
MDFALMFNKKQIFFLILANKNMYVENLEKGENE